MIDSNTIKHYLSHLLFFGIIINAIFLYSLFQITKTLYDSHYNLINKTIMEYGEFDLEHICKITNCQKIKTDQFTNDKSTYELGVYGVLIPTPKKIEVEYNWFGFQFDKELNSIIIYPDLQLQIELRNSETYIALIYLYGGINLAFVFIFTLMYFRNSFSERERSLLSLTGKENSIQEKYVNLLNENINHELNTPVAILRSKLKKLELEIMTALKKQTDFAEISNCKNNSCINALNGIDLAHFTKMSEALDIITQLMERTSNWKQIKYSNGNTSVHKIINNVVDSMGLFTRSNITFEIGESLKEIVLMGTYKNADLQLCIFNSIKNSIEAKSNIIRFEGNLFRDTLELYIIDNGHGLKDKNGNILPEQYWQKIFDPYYSLKDTDIIDKKLFIFNWVYEFYEKFLAFNKYNVEIRNKNEIRGIGTYINKITLKNNKGDLTIVETSESGTVFKIKTKAEFIMRCVE